jgi:hypothetical protein
MKNRFKAKIRRDYKHEDIQTTRSIVTGHIIFSGL